MENKSRNVEEKESPWIFRIQLVIVFSFASFATGVIVWIVRLIYVSWDLKDTFSGSIGIAILAATIFGVIFGAFQYLFWGLRRAAHQDDSSES